MQQITGVAVILVTGGALVAAGFYMRRKWMRSRRTRRRARADLSGIVGNPRD